MDGDKEEIKTMIDNISELWILEQIKIFIENMTKEG